jgi:hypothetical protein
MCSRMAASVMVPDSATTMNERSTFKSMHASIS